MSAGSSYRLNGAMVLLVAAGILMSACLDSSSARESTPSPPVRATEPTPSLSLRATEPTSECPETQPIRDRLPDPSLKGFADVWWADGIIWAAPALPYRGNWYAGRNGQKVGWWRNVNGKLAVSGRRLDGPSAPLVASIPDGYGLRGFQASGIWLPEPGCWQITATAGSHVFIFVVSAKPSDANPVG